MGGRRQRKSNEMRSLFPKGRPKSGTPSNFSPIMEGSSSPLSPHSSSFGRSREDLLMTSVGSLGMARSRENISKSRESLSKSIRGSREEVTGGAQGNLTEPPSSSLSKYTFLNVTTSRNLDTIEEPLEPITELTLDVEEPEIKVKENILLDLEIPPIEPVTLVSSNSSLSSCGNFLLTYATPPFMENMPAESQISSSNAGSLQDSSKTCNVLCWSPRTSFPEISQSRTSGSVNTLSLDPPESGRSSQFQSVPILASSFSPQPSKASAGSSKPTLRESSGSSTESYQKQMARKLPASYSPGARTVRSTNAEKNVNKSGNKTLSSSLPNWTLLIMKKSLVHIEISSPCVNNLKCI